MKKKVKKGLLAEMGFTKGGGIMNWFPGHRAAATRAIRDRLKVSILVIEVGEARVSLSLSIDFSIQKNVYVKSMPLVIKFHILLRLTDTTVLSKRRSPANARWKKARHRSQQERFGQSQHNAALLSMLTKGSRHWRYIAVGGMRDLSVVPVLARAIC